MSGYYDKSLRRRAAHAMCMALEEAGVKRIELARRLGTRPPYVTALLRGSENVTVDQLERVLDALGFDVALTLVTRPKPKGRR